MFHGAVEPFDDPLTMGRVRGGPDDLGSVTSAQEGDVTLKLFAVVYPEGSRGTKCRKKAVFKGIGNALGCTVMQQADDREFTVAVDKVEQMVVAIAGGADVGDKVGGPDDAGSGG